MEIGILTGVAGVTQIAASEFASNPEDRARTRAFLATQI